MHADAHLPGFAVVDGGASSGLFCLLGGRRGLQGGLAPDGKRSCLISSVMKLWRGDMDEVCFGILRASGTAICVRRGHGQTGREILKHARTLTSCLRHCKDHQANKLLLVLSHRPDTSAGLHRSVPLNKKPLFAQIRASSTPTGVLSGTDRSKVKAGPLNQRK